MVVGFGKGLNFRAVLVLVLTFSLTLNHNLVQSSVSVSEDGGYSFTIAVDEGVPEPESAVAFVDNIRTSLQRFTAELFESTKGYFYIENVKLLLPQSWESELTESFPDATSESYSTSDLRLSTVTHPFVANPNPCGLPGSHIELPARFLSGNAYDDHFGPIAKALVTQWARFRWGVWEEHGYPSNARFPYFYKEDPTVDESWSATGCSDMILEGTFTNTSGATCAAPSATCRFRPSITNKATTSLMGFHWLESIQHFCDESSHNKLAPNKQNLYCNHRSVWEVIRSSPDFKEREPLESIPTPKLSTVKRNRIPVFHLLLDRGYIGGDNEQVIMTKIIRGLVELFNSDRDIISAVSSFYSEGTDLKFTNLVPWMTIKGNSDEFVDAIANIRSDFPVLRDFSDGLAQVMASIADVNPDGGAIVLMVKTGTVPDYSTVQNEEAILASMIRTKTKLFTAEFESSTANFLQMKHLTESTGGAHLTFGDASLADEQVAAMVRLIRDQLDYEPTPITDDTQLLMDANLAPSVSTSTIQLHGLPEVHIQLTLPYALVPELQIEVSGPFIGSLAQVPSHTRNEWNEDTDAGRRNVYTYTILSPTYLGNFAFHYTCEGCDANTRAHVVVSGVQNPLKVVTISTTTTAVENAVDFAKPLPELSPFAIYTTVHLNHRPVTNAKVVATVWNPSGTPEYVPLLDDASSSADVQKGDGIYSSIYIPNVNGAHTISVSVTVEGQDQQPGQVPSQGQTSRLIPVDQEEFGCPESECGGVILPAPFASVSSFEEPVTFSNLANFTRGRPSKVLDLAAIVTDPETPNSKLRLAFTSPKITGTGSNEEKSKLYRLYGSNNWEDLQGSAGILIKELSQVSSPGSAEVFIEDVKFFGYYAIHSVYEQGGTELIMMSNIAHLIDYKFKEDEPPSTTESANPGTGEPTPDPGTGPTQPNPGTSPTSPTATGSPGPGTEADDKKAFFKTAGGIVVIILIVLIVLGAIGGGIWFYMKKQRNAVSMNP